MSRKTSKSFKILKNIAEVAFHFPIDEPLLSIGCGDGFELDVWKLLGYNVLGIDLDKEKVDIAVKHGCNAIYIPVEDFNPYTKMNVYCSHTLEHCRNSSAVIKKVRMIALSTVCIIVPIEKQGTKNPAHLSPVKSISDIIIKDMHVVRCYENFNYEYQGIIVWKK